MSTGGCAQAKCSVIIEDLTKFTLSPIPDSLFRFQRWITPADFECPVKDATRLDGTIQVEISKDSGCIAVFEAEGPGSGTVPGGDH